jgi:hypothetical protein
MHPLTVYDIAIQDHERATEQRRLQHLLARRLRERTRPPAPGPSSRRLPAVRRRAVA